MPQKAVSLQVVPPARYIRFGPFELDSRAGELRKHSIKIRLQQQGFQILLMLVKHPGEVVLREEIRQNLWPHNTAVEFDHSINAAIQKLRDALGESASNPRYIETLPRRGYRFIGTVETPPAEPVGESAPSAPEAAEPAPAPAGQIRGPLPWLLPVAGLTVLLGVLAVAGWLRPGAVRAPVGNWKLSLGAVGNAVASPDGSAVAYRSPRGLEVRRMDSLEETPVYKLDRLVDAPSWSPDGSQLLFRTATGLIRLPLPNGPPLVIWPKLTVTRGYAWAPDGTILSATSSGKPDGGKLYLIHANARTLSGVTRRTGAEEWRKVQTAGSLWIETFEGSRPRLRRMPPGYGR